MLRRCARRFTPTSLRADVIGIDLGTTNSCVAAIVNGEPQVFENAEGKRTTPSIVSFNKNGQRLIGIPAKRQAVTNPANTFYAVKRLIGRRFDDPATQNDVKTLPYKIHCHTNGDAWVTAEATGRKYSPAQIGGFVLEKMKSAAETRLSKKVTDAVITCPAYFNDSQRQATKDAGKLAGLNVLRIINEPTAAALAFGFAEKQKREAAASKDSSGGESAGGGSFFASMFDKVLGSEQKGGSKVDDDDALVAVFDLGGGTFDVSILSIGGGVFEVKSTNGDTHLGGEDFDAAITKKLADILQKQEGVDVLNGKHAGAAQRLREAAEKAKCELDHAQQTEINIAYLVQVDGDWKHLKTVVTREMLEEWTDSLCKATLEPCKKAMADAGCTKKELSEVLMVGGMTRMPKVQQTVKEFFGKKPFCGVNPDEAVAIGAALQGAMIANSSSSSNELEASVKGLVLVDVTPLTLGTEIHTGKMVPMIPKNSTIPRSVTKGFTTLSDMQTSVHFTVYQGEREIAKHNKLLGEFTLAGIPPAPKGVPQIDVTFALDRDGILNVTAKDKASGRTQNVTVTCGGGLNQSEIERMLKEAEMYAKQDREMMEATEAKAKAEECYSRSQSELARWQHVPQSQKDNVKAAAEDLRKFLDAAGREGDATKISAEEMKKLMAALDEVVMAASKIDYQANASSGSGGDDNNQQGTK